MRKIILNLFVLLITGCASSSGIPVIKFEVGIIPNDELIHTISAGDTLYSSYKYSASPSARIVGLFSINMLDDGSTSSKLILTKLSNKEAYCGNFNRHTPGHVKQWYGCFVDSNSDGHFEELIYSGSSFSINGNPRYTKTTNIVEGFKHEIIFQGRTETTLKFKYREFSNHMARPAFTQDFEYFINKAGMTSGNFKGLKIEIISIDGNYINYLVKGSIGML